MRFDLAIIAVLATAAVPAFAQGDAAKGEKLFNQCQTCHTVVDPDGKKLAGRGAQIGPNLYDVYGRKAGSYPDFKYGKDMVAAGEAGLVWDEAHFVQYVQDPTGFLKDYLKDPKAKGKMAFKLKDAAAAEDVYAYLIQFSPDAPAAGGAAAPADPPPAPSN